MATLTEQQIKKIIRSVLKEFNEYTLSPDDEARKNRLDRSLRNQRKSPSQETENQRRLSSYKLSNPRSKKDVNFLMSAVENMRQIFNYIPGSDEIDRGLCDSAINALSAIHQYAPELMSDDDWVFLDTIFDGYDIEDYSAEDLNRARQIVNDIESKITSER